jgi:hypothetical protein
MKRGRPEEEVESERKREEKSNNKQIKSNQHLFTEKIFLNCRSYFFLSLSLTHSSEIFSRTTKHDKYVYHKLTTAHGREREREVL